MRYGVLLAIIIFLFVPGKAVFDGWSIGEPALPTSDPMDNVRKRSQGYQVNGTIAVDAKNNFYHMQHLVVDYHRLDIKTPPASITTVPASCTVGKPNRGDEIHLIIARAGARGKSLTKHHQPSFTSFSAAKVEGIAQNRAKTMKKTGRSTGIASGTKASMGIMTKKDIVITAHEKPVFLVLTGRWPTLYNFTVAPYSSISGVLVYTDEGAAAISGLDPSIPVYFKSAEDPKTENCFVRTENKPDATWSGHKKAMRIPKGGSTEYSRYHLLAEVHKKFARQVRKDVGFFDDETFINVEGANYFLIGPAPTHIEQRIPYSPVAGSHVRVLENDYIEFGSDMHLAKYMENVVNARFDQILTVGG